MAPTISRDLEAALPPNEKSIPTDTLASVQSTQASTSSVPDSSNNKVETTTHQTLTDSDPNIISWDSPEDPENPMNWSWKLKIINVVIVSIWTLLTPLASSMVAPGIQNVLEEFHSDSITMGSFVVSIFILGYAVGPLVIAPLSESYGRLGVYHVMNSLFVIWTLACAFAPSLGALLAFRFFQGVAGVTSLTIGSGTIADLIPPNERGKFMSIYSCGPLLGPVIGPIGGAYLVQAAGWRWIFRVLAIASGIMTVFTFITMGESYAPVVLRRKVQRLQKETGNMNLRSKLDSGLTFRQVLRRAIVRPTKMLFLSPIVALLSLYMAVVYAYLYLLFTTISSLFEDVYGFSQGAAGLAYLGIGVGLTLGLITFGATSDKIVTHLANKNGGERKPEYRLPYMMIGALFVPVGLFWYGWSAEAKLHWIMPIIGTSLVGVGILITFMPISTYLVDAFTIHAASAMAANTVFRSLVGAFLPLAGPSLYKNLGLGWGNSVLAFIALAVAPVSLGLYVYGERIRTSKRFKVEF